MLMCFGDQHCGSDDELHSVGSSVFWDFKRETRFDINLN